MIIDEIVEKGRVNIHKEDQEEVKAERFKAIKETTLRQIEKCSFYRQFCKMKNFDPRTDMKDINDVHKIPYLTTANFKQKSGKPKELLCVDESEIVAWTLSSGTSGDPSMIGRDLINWQRYMKLFDFILEELADAPKYDWSLFFQPPAQRLYEMGEKIERPQHHMGYIFNLANKIPMGENRKYGLKLASEEDRKQGKMFEFDPEGTFGFLNANPSSRGIGWVGGSLPVLYMTLTGYQKKTGQVFDIGQDSFLMSGGGWKTYQGDAVSPEKFREDISKILGIRKEKILDVYAFTETACIFAECEHHNKHSLPWQDVVIRDVETLEPVEMGETGLVNVINPMAYSFAGVSILQDDIAKITMEDTCPCGRKGKILEVIGRAEGAEAKGCGAQMAEETKY